MTPHETGRRITTISGLKVSACGQMSVVVTKFLYPRFNESITMAHHPGRAMACQTLSSQLLQPQKQLFITGKVLSETGNGLPPLGSSGMPSTTKGVLPSNRSNVLTHVAPYIHTVGAAKKPLAASLPATPALGHLHSQALPRRQLQSQALSERLHGHPRG